MKRTNKKHKLNLANKISTIILVIMAVFVMAGFGFLYFIFVNAPEFNTDLLY